MIKKLLDYFRSEDDLDPSFIRLTRNILIFVMAVSLAILPLVTGILGGEQARNPLAFFSLLALLVFEGISLYFVLQGRILLAKLVIPIALLMAISAIAISTNGIRDTSFIAIPVVLVISAVLLGRRSLSIITPLAIIMTVAIAIVDINTNRQPRPIGVDDAIIVPLLIITSGGITHLLIARLNESIVRAQKSEQIQKMENMELMELRQTLEEKVLQRTAELEKVNQLNEKRARQFSTVAQVMSAISSVQVLDELLPRITQVVSEQFNIYHTGIFLLDANREKAILRAANSEGGQRMLARKHSLPVGQTGIVGYVAATGQPRIALDVGADSAYFDNPDLPNTHSEIALPLRYAGQIIGVLDVQSLEVDAFQPDDVSILTTLADQISIAINNALTIEQANKALLEAQSAIGQVGQEAWQILRPKELGLGFSYSESGVKPLQRSVVSEEIVEAVGKGEVVHITGPEQNSRLAIPIHLRGQLIGIMQLNTRSGYKLTEDDADIAKAVAERLSLAIETATLLQSTQHRADIERITTNITSRISSSARFETILQTAAQELSRALGGSDVLVQIEPAALKMYT